MVIRNQALQKFVEDSYRPSEYGYDSLRGLGAPEVLPPEKNTDIDFLAPIVDLISDKVALADGSARALADQITSSSEFRSLVANESKKNSGYVLLVALAGGVLGGTILRGTVSTVVAAGVLGWAGYKILSSGAPDFPGGEIKKTPKVIPGK